ncbi:adhesion G-protein coupled receptor G2-like [Orbicella faveolata]|uniref:adhesion G-protein coupled receptor G2-like n=1 Tax=Orbicella faveolata TaxID=48498 RepID=UPI0009E509E1|nr:adhesion G-protein coupled receptor G2-like [Orbicella faveolata]XP_020615362.1 adhesion G-protein coupled receptor G2-like [Orbicella faveolata]
MKNSDSHGNVMKTTCPQTTVQPEIQTLCETVDNTDFLRRMPVVDEIAGIVYRNVFCARCNAVINVSYWRMTADCGPIPASALPQDNALLLAFIRENCTVKYQPTDKQRKYLKNCLVTKSNCSSKQIVEKEPVLQDLCSHYAFPVCGNSHRKNLHCALCNGDDITQVNCGCLAPVTSDPPTQATTLKSTTLQHQTNPGSTSSTQTTTSDPTTLTTGPESTTLLYTMTSGTTPPPFTTGPWSTPPPRTTIPWTTPPMLMTTLMTSAMTTTDFPREPVPPPLNILFDFSSNQISIKGKTTQTKVVAQKTCQEGFVYDPFVQNCREAFHKVIANPNISINSTNSTNSTSDVEIMLNCSGIQLNSSDTVLLPNGTLWVPLHSTGYNRTDYFMNGSFVFLCSNFASNYSKRETIARWSYVVSPLQIITYAGCSVSVLSLLILLVVYCVFKELRTLPGKNLINLSFAMIFYHIFLFVAGLRNIQALCTGIAILLHYFLLCSFAWMSVMAFDVAKTFVFHDNAARSQPARNSRRTLFKYCVCAWGLPAVVVVTCFALDYTDTVGIGYGHSGFCWIKNGTTLLAVVGVPVAMAIVFNFAALTWTVISIYKVRKVTSKLSDQGSHSSLALLCIKLTGVLGLTWVFGFLSSIVKTDATAYLFVVVNSLQGFFIFLTFVAKKRTVTLLRGAKKKYHEGGHSTYSINTFDTKL